MQFLSLIQQNHRDKIDELATEVEKLREQLGKLIAACPKHAWEVLEIENRKIKICQCCGQVKQCHQGPRVYTAEKLLSKVG